MNRRSSAERARRLAADLSDARRYPEHSLTPDERAELHEQLSAQGWKPGKRLQRPQPTATQCLVCRAECEPAEHPLDRLCERCREMRRSS